MGFFVSDACSFLLSCRSILENYMQSMLQYVITACHVLSACFFSPMTWPGMSSEVIHCRHIILVRYSVDERQFL